MGSPLTLNTVCTGKMMIKKLLFIFPVSLVIFYLLILQGIQFINGREQNLDREQALIIQEQVKDRFNLFLRLPLNLGKIGADYYGLNDKLIIEDNPFVGNLLNLNNDILGFSILNKEGLIVSVFPLNDNRKAKGRRTQNLKPLLESYEKNESFWFSQPFELFQGGLGFVFYVPIVNQKKELKGWFAPVISPAQFDEDFKLDKFLKTYHLNISDVKTEKSYFTTGIEPEKNFIQTQTKFFGRDIRITTWRKVPYKPLSPEWYLILLLALIPSAILIYTMKLYNQKKTARRQLKDISMLLRLTSKEALAKLIDLQAEFYKIGSTEDMTFVNNLMEQIELLQTLADSGEEITTRQQEFLPLLQNELKSIQEVIEKKALKVSYSLEALQNIHIDVNSWILQNCVLSNILIHSIIHAEMGTGINIDTKDADDKTFITFHTQMVMRGNGDKEAVSLDRRMEVARHALSLFRGELFLQHDLAGGIIIRIILPH